MNEDWIEHRRAGDRERLGWLVPAGEGFVAVNLLGRPITGEMDWLSAEESLEHAGIGYLADQFTLVDEVGTAIAVRIVEVSEHRITVKSEDFGDIRAQQEFFHLSFPAPANLFPRER
ncbi:hypothetical protein [Humidisolicoccus flavus]|uniref:hypothetical protein n=1 Tax=Humidisolicoccus flavus TaxID=3111414 RepID=UPI00324F633C